MEAVAFLIVLGVLVLALWCIFALRVSRLKQRPARGVIGIDLAPGSPPAIARHGMRMRAVSSGRELAVWWPWWRRVLFGVGFKSAAGPFRLRAGQRVELPVREVS